MAAILRFEEIEAWQTARELTKLVYQLSNQGAFSRDFGLRDQMRRAAVSVMSNIAEGFESRTRPLFVDFLGRAKASCAEVRAQAYVCIDVGYVSQDEFEHVTLLGDRCARQIRGFINYLQRSTQAHAEIA